MPVTIEILEQQQIIVMHLQGQMTAVEVVAEYEKLFKEKDFKYNMNVLWDISGMNLTRIPIQEVRTLPRLMIQFAEQRGENYKAALTTNRTGDYQLLKIYLALLKLIGRQVRVRVFPTAEEAIEWITE